MRLILLLLALTTFASSQSRYEVYCPAKVLQKALDTAQSQVGVKEATNNNDGEVEKYVEFASGKRQKLPYCASGLCWSFGMSSLDLYGDLRGMPFQKTTLAANLFDQIRIHGRKTGYTAHAGDFINWKFLSTPNGHIEIVIGTKKAGWVQTIGFNTSSGAVGSQRDGGGVYIRSRNLRAGLGKMAIRGLAGFTTTSTAPRYFPYNPCKCF